MHRFFISAPLADHGAVALPPDVVRQISRVLRLKPGDPIVLFSGDGSEFEAALEPAEDGLRARILERRIPDVELRGRLAIALAVLKGEKLDWTVQKLTEIGVHRISLLLTERTVVAAGEERWSRRMERYRRIAREAAEQSGRVRLPLIDEPGPLAEWLARSTEGGMLLLDPAAERTLLAALSSNPSSVTIIVGPEGGFAPSEAAAIREAGAEPARLGARILRAETAAIACAALAAAVREPGPGPG